MNTKLLPLIYALAGVTPLALANDLPKLSINLSGTGPEKKRTEQSESSGVSQLTSGGIILTVRNEPRTEDPDYYRKSALKQDEKARLYEESASDKKEYYQDALVRGTIGINGEAVARTAAIAGDVSSKILQNMEGVPLAQAAGYTLSALKSEVVSVEEGSKGKLDKLVIGQMDAALKAGTAADKYAGQKFISSGPSIFLNAASATSLAAEGEYVRASGKLLQATTRFKTAGFALDTASRLQSVGYDYVQNHQQQVRLLEDLRKSIANSERLAREARIRADQDRQRETIARASGRIATVPNAAPPKRAPVEAPAPQPPAPVTRGGGVK